MIYRMLEYLYMQDYTVDLGFDPFWSVIDSWTQTRLHVHAQMYSLGDKYDLPGLKKEALRRFINDIAIPGDKKRETLTLLSVIPTVYTTTPESDRGLRDLVARHIFQRYKIASKLFIKELDTALKVPQFARDIVILDRNRPAIDFTALTKKLHRYWHRCLQKLRTVATSLSNAAAAAAFRTRVLATRVTLNGIGNFAAIVLLFCTMFVIFFMLLGFFLALFLFSIAELARFMDFATQLQCEMCKHLTTNDCRMMQEILSVTELRGI